MRWLHRARLAGGTVIPTGTSVVLLGTDTTTEGVWTGVYGSKGYMLGSSSAGNISAPSGVTPSLSGQTWYAGGPYTVPAAQPQVPGGGSTYDSFWYSSTSLTLDILQSAGHVATVSAYLCEDLVTNTRTVAMKWQTPTGIRLAGPYPQTLPDTGIYYRWTVTGHCQLVISYVSGTGGNAVFQGCLFD